MVFPRIGRAKARLLVLVILTFIIVYSTYTNFSRENDLEYLKEKIGYYSSYEENIKPIVGQKNNNPKHLLFDKIFDIFDRASINITGDIGDAIQYIDKSKQKEGPNSKSTLLSKAYISPEVVNELKTKHEIVKRDLPKALSDNAYTKAYNKETTGVVMVGGSRFSWLAYLSIIALRKTGSNLPVELLLPQHDDFVKERQFCNSVLPKVNARCVVLPEELGASVMYKWSDKLANYQFKSLALMTSSFQNVLLLDADNIILRNPNKVFESDLFKEYGMITWPDYWRRTISPVFYDISDTEVDEHKRVRYNRFPLNVKGSKESNIGKDDLESVPYHELEGTIPDLSTESGQLFINKATHSCTLLLSMYYNMYGPNIYYKLFSLGEQGEGDKDTFPAAAVVCNQKFYQVLSLIRTFGYFGEEGNFQGVAMGQKDPLTDHSIYEEKVQNAIHQDPKLSSIDTQIEKIEPMIKDEFGEGANPLFAVHCNYPKLDPLDLITKEELFDTTNLRLKYRLYSGLTYNDPSNPQRKLDFELEQWKSIEQILCRDSIYFAHFKGHTADEICTFTKNQVKWLLSPESS